MRRSLFLFPCLAILALPAARADSPFLVSGPDADSLSTMLTAAERHNTFPDRFVTFLSEDDSLASTEVDDQTQENDPDLRLMLIEGDDERRDTDAANDQDRVTENRVREAIDSASPKDRTVDDRATAIQRHDAAPPTDAAPPSDADRLTARLAELNKPATRLRVAAPSAQVGEAPVNQAAQIFDQTPLWIRGGLSVPPPAQRVHVAFYHNPTYFQELNLERCGRLDCERFGYLQNLYSSVWFVGNTAMLPSRIASQPTYECVASYGDCRSCHQYDCPIEPLWMGDDCAATRRGMLSQSAALAGFVLLLW